MSGTAFLQSMRNDEVSWTIAQGRLTKIAVNTVHPSDLSGLNIIVTNSSNNPPQLSDFKSKCLLILAHFGTGDPHKWVEEMVKQYSLPNRRELQSVPFFPLHYLRLKIVSPFGRELPFVERDSLGKIIFENLSARYEHYLNNKDSRDLHPRLFCYGPPGWCRYYHYSQKQELEKVERS